jgi:tRNA uridine 5-carboxymethylaminomethyl modification enzyme
VKQFWRKPGFPYPPGSILERAGGQIPCYITHTTEATAKIIREHLHESPLYAGEIKGIGPRYCPSIEDKIVRFPEKPTHQLFLEPEGINTEEFYLNGFSTSLPFPVQLQMIRTVVGCENAEIIRPAYAVEYDFCNPIQITHWLETKICKNLFLAGQINGTSGYEEAAAQGIMAGINAALRVKGHPPLVLGRDQAYIGVLIDDLVTKGVTEPYRIFTSRAEFRLLLRQDNADLRLSEIGYRIGLLPKHRYNRVVEKKRLIDEELQRLKKTRVGNETLEKLLMRPEITYKDLPDRRDDLPDEVIYEVEVMVKYAGFIERQLVEVQRLKSLESKEIPENFDFNAVLGLRTEARIKLSQVRPRTIGQAARIPGVSPADISVLSIWLARTYGSNDSLVPPPDQENKE